MLNIKSNLAYLKRNQIEILKLKKLLITKIKNTADACNSRFDTSTERICELENRSEEIFQIVGKRQNIGKYFKMKVYNFSTY